MFQLRHMSDSFDFALPYTPYNSEDALYAESRGSHMSFRVQRLGTYLVSNLFRAEYMAPADFVHNQRLVSLCRGKELYFTGECFDQWDLDVLLYCVVNTPAPKKNPGMLQFSPADLLRGLKLRNTALNRQRVYDSLQRLHNGVIDIRGKDYQYMTRFINRVLLNTRKDTCRVEINGDVAATFRANGVPASIQDRQSLGRNGLAKWLYGTTMAFQGGFTADAQSLHLLAGQETKRIQCFSKRLNVALDLLAAKGLIERWNASNKQIQVVSHAMQMHDTSCGLLRLVTKA